MKYGKFLSVSLELSVQAQTLELRVVDALLPASIEDFSFRL